MEKGTGLLNLDTLREAIRPETVLVSVMAVNNEIGVVQPLKQISEVMGNGRGGGNGLRLCGGEVGKTLPQDLYFHRRFLCCRLPFLILCYTERCT